MTVYFCVNNMDRVAILSPCVLPVPSVKGGAVEDILTRILKDNRKKKRIKIDLYSICEDKELDLSFECNEYSAIIPVKDNCIIKTADIVRDKLNRELPIESARRFIDHSAITAFFKRVSELDANYDAVIVVNQASLAVSLLSALEPEYDLPVYFYMHNDVDIYRSKPDIQWLVSRGVIFIAVSNYIKNRIIEQSEGAVVKVLYNGVSVPKERCHVRDNDKFRFLFSGRIIKEKGVKELVTAFIKLLNISSDNKNRYELGIIGFSDTTTKYEKEILDYIEKYSGNIKYYKKCSHDEMLSKYEEYNSVVMPTIGTESFCLVALETIARGIPLITTNGGALPEIVGDGALVIDKNHNIIDGLVDAMIKISTDQAYTNELRVRAYNRVQGIEEFNVDNFYDNFVDLISENDINYKISVIIPVYNVVDYLDRCIDSILKQTYNNLEVIMIDDGSTDGSGPKCDRYAAFDNRIKVTHTENMGLSAARNAGIEKASGDFLFFCDSDDYIENNAIEKMVEKQKKTEADVVACGISKVSSSKDAITSKVPGTWNGHESIVQMIRSNNVCTVVWNKLYRAELFDQIRFNNISYHEDEDIVYKLLYSAKIVTYMPDCYYNYCQRNGSFMNKGLDVRYKCLLQAVKGRYDFFAQRNEYELAQLSLIDLYEKIKYIYRNIDIDSDKDELTKMYKDYIKQYGVPRICGLKKMFAIWVWKVFRYNNYE